VPDKALHGNGVPCPACELRRDNLRESRAMDQSVGCNFCGGEGRVGKATQEIIREACEWARREYWPAREAEWAAAEVRDDA
jgi:hypothetical protein